MTLTLSWTHVDVSLDRISGRVDYSQDIEKMRSRYVYVIQTPEARPIKYDDGKSRICYIGRSGRSEEKKSRIFDHSGGWMLRFLSLSADCDAFRISYCHPRRPKMEDAYKDAEAYLLRLFREKFGSHPLFNKRSESEIADYEVDINTSIFRRLDSKTKTKLKSFILPDDLAIEE